MTRVPTINLNQLASYHEQAQNPKVQCHIFGIFLEERQTNNSNGATLWILCDESHPLGVEIKLLGDIQTYPQPEPGDIVRVHRLMFDNITGRPIVVDPRNVVLWRAFRYKPEPVTTAKNPTIKQEDDKRRRILETHYTSILSRMSELPNKTYSNNKFSRVCGRVNNTSFDHYGNRIVEISDGSGSCDLRVFPKKLDFETDDHFKSAFVLKPSDFVVITGAKLNSTNSILDLSANKRLGRSIRLVEKDSILGVKIQERLENQPQPDDIVGQPSDLDIRQGQTRAQDNNNQILGTNSQQNPPLRRSPRLNPNNPSQSPQSTQIHDLSEDELPYKQLSDLRHKNGYDFYDFAGQVRGKPNMTRHYNNYVLQLYDGSKPTLTSYHVDEVKVPIEDCVTIIFYKPERPSDTDEHIRTVTNISDGDFVEIKNVKVSSRDGKLKLEMSANKSHNKSIKVIDIHSELGGKLMNKVMYKPVEEALVNPTEMSTQESYESIDVV